MMLKTETCYGRPATSDAFTECRFYSTSILSSAWYQLITYFQLNFSLWQMLQILNVSTDSFNFSFAEDVGIHIIMAHYTKQLDAWSFLILAFVLFVYLRCIPVWMELQEQNSNTKKQKWDGEQRSRMGMRLKFLHNITSMTEVGWTTKAYLVSRRVSQINAIRFLTVFYTVI